MLLFEILSDLLKIDNLFDKVDYILVQGDTTSALAIAISAYNHNKKVIHLEAGLRTNNKYNPYPEELNRQLISRIAEIHLCPTKLNKTNLKSENIHRNIYVTGNTGLDGISKKNTNYGNKVLITIHRRDNHPIIKEWFINLSNIAKKYTDLEFIIPIHPNPNVKKYSYLLENIKVIDPLSHNELLDLIKQSRFVISDSGGIQEECSYLNKKIIICRKTTERPEILGKHGVLCNNPEKLNSIVDKVYNDYNINELCPFGDGYAWCKIVKILNRVLI